MADQLMKKLDTLFVVFLTLNCYYLLTHVQCLRYIYLNLLGAILGVTIPSFDGHEVKSGSAPSFFAEKWELFVYSLD